MLPGIWESEKERKVSEKGGNLHHMRLHKRESDRRTGLTDCKAGCKVSRGSECRTRRDVTGRGRELKMTASDDRRGGGTDGSWSLSPGERKTEGKESEEFSLTKRYDMTGLSSLVSLMREIGNVCV